MLKKLNATMAVCAASLLLLTGCPNDSNSTRTYKVTLKNVTVGQPLAPAAIIVQNSSTNFKAFEIGQSASVGLETLAEGGNPQVLLDEANAANVLYTNRFLGVTAPGSTSSHTFTINSQDVKLTLASMPVKTNDGFVGAKNIDLNFTGTKTFNLNVYDAGTEANDELTSTVPALGGEGFNSARSDTNNFVTLHTGVVTADDGLSSSGLVSTDKWDNPAAILTIERVK